MLINYMLINYMMGARTSYTTTINSRSTIFDHTNVNSDSSSLPSHMFLRASFTAFSLSPFRSNFCQMKNCSSVQIRGIPNVK